MNFEKSHLTPTIESKVFVGHYETRFALGIVAINNVIVNGFENEFNGAAQLRANAYLDKGFVSSDDLDDNGLELDEHDPRSVHFVMLERTPFDHLARVVGNARLVVKSEEHPDPLPLEGYRKDIFDDNPIPVGGVEVSRLIAVHEDSRIQNALKWPFFIAGQKYMDINNLSPVYGLMTPALTRLLRMQGIPASAKADATYIEEINATKQPVSINMKVLKKLISIAGDEGIDVMKDSFSHINIADKGSKGLKVS